MKTKDALQALLDLPVSLSMDCNSGVIGDLCRCWRCRGESGPTSDETAAERDAEIVRRVREFSGQLGHSALRQAFHSGVLSELHEGRARAVVDAALAWDEDPGNPTLCFGLSEACCDLRADRDVSVAQGTKIPEERQ